MTRGPCSSRTNGSLRSKGRSAFLIHGTALAPPHREDTPSLTPVSASSVLHLHCLLPSTFLYLQSPFFCICLLVLSLFPSRAVLSLRNITSHIYHFACFRGHIKKKQKIIIFYNIFFFNSIYTKDTSFQHVSIERTGDFTFFFSY